MERKTCLNLTRACQSYKYQFLRRQECENQSRWEWLFRRYEIHCGFLQEFSSTSDPNKRNLSKRKWGDPLREKWANLQWLGGQKMKFWNNNLLLWQERSE